MANAIRFGTVWINDHITMATEMPHGGFKQSGYGKDMSKYALEDYTIVKHVMVNLEGGVQTYSFLTAWLLDAERRAVWWELRRRELAEVVARRGARHRCSSRTSTTGSRGAAASPTSSSSSSPCAVDEPRSMTGDAHGELHRDGHWRLFEQDGVTAVTYEWNVHTTKAWMNALAPIARPVFEYNHNVVMRWGGEGLARLGCNLLAAG